MSQELLLVVPFFTALDSSIRLLLSCGNWGEIHSGCNHLGGLRRTEACVEEFAAALSGNTKCLPLLWRVAFLLTHQCKKGHLRCQLSLPVYSLLACVYIFFGATLTSFVSRCRNRSCQLFSRFFCIGLSPLGNLRCLQKLLHENTKELASETESASYHANRKILARHTLKLRKTYSEARVDRSHTLWSGVQIANN